MRRAALVLALLLAPAAPAAGQVFEHPGAEPLRVAALLRDGSPAGDVTVRVQRVGDGLWQLVASAPGARTIGVRFEGTAEEALFGTGERSDAVDRRGRETEHYVADGPFRAEDRAYVAPLTPPWAVRDRDDATYFPVPWVLSSRGWGVHVRDDATSRLDARGRDWSVDADGEALRLLVVAGPTPAQALGRFTAATGRQPPPAASWAFGPWFQTGQPNVVAVEEERAITKVQRDAGVPVSAAETQMHYLPCGAHRDRRAAERERAASFHRDGLARLVYFNPLLCASYVDLFARAAGAGVLQQAVPGVPFVYPAFVGGAAPLGFSSEPLAQFDFTHPATEDFMARLVAEAVADGADGWMEDFGESTAPLVVQHDGSTGDAAHNRYPTDYHCALRRIAARFDRPLVRFQRSGWTGSARCADVVWGGDPTTLWGFDGLSSAVRQVLSMGLSGVARWGTDIGGYNSFGAGYADVKPGATEDQRLTPELLDRWIELGALVPVMRTKRTGLAVPSYDRPQVFDPPHLGQWRRMTELHLQLHPYLSAADEEHRRSGLPIVRHLVLAHPQLREARETHDQYLLGPDLLVAPVTAPGVAEREAWLPPGRWVDWWRSVDFTEPDGAYVLRRTTVLTGARRVALPAPVGRPPLLVRAGAVLPLLGADVDTLSPYGREAGLVRAADRAGRLRLLVVPRGTTLSQLGAGRSARSVEQRGRWVLRVRAPRRTRWEVEASLATLRRPFAARQVLANGRRLPRSRWSYDGATRVLRLVLRGSMVRLEVRR